MPFDRANGGGEALRVAAARFDHQALRLRPQAKARVLDLTIAPYSVHYEAERRAHGMTIRKFEQGVGGTNDRLRHRPADRFGGGDVALQEPYPFIMMAGLDTEPARFAVRR